ncbi:MAG: methylated-DNA--[Clostridia bacterium]|nr:methylated-DNA--[protein]-cysteine S-methyltransferase [Clostridia bacterium]
MKYKSFYKTPEGFSDMVMISDGEALTNLYFEGSRDEKKADEFSEERELEIFRETKKWLDIYFGGNVPDFTPKYKIENLTPFRKEVSDMMIKIPYGKTVTYGFIAKEIAKKQGKEKMSAQAVGGAVGWNPLCIIIPCHRVVGKKGKLTGYGGGMENKTALLRLEKTI